MRSRESVIDKDIGQCGQGIPQTADHWPLPPRMIAAHSQSTKNLPVCHGGGCLHGRITQRKSGKTKFASQHFAKRLATGASETSSVTRLTFGRQNEKGGQAPARPCPASSQIVGKPAFKARPVRDLPPPTIGTFRIGTQQGRGFPAGLRCIKSGKRASCNLSFLEGHSESKSRLFHTVYNSRSQR